MNLFRDIEGTFSWNEKTKMIVDYCMLLDLVIWLFGYLMIRDWSDFLSCQSRMTFVIGVFFCLVLLTIVLWYSWRTGQAWTEQKGVRVVNFKCRTITWQTWADSLWQSANCQSESEANTIQMSHSDHVLWVWVQSWILTPARWKEKISQKYFSENLIGDTKIL